MIPEVLRSLSPEMRDIVLKDCLHISLPAGSTVIEERALDTDLYFLQKGQVLVRSFSATGAEVAFKVMEAGECVGEFSAIDGLPRSASVEALTSVTLAHLPRSRFLELMRCSPDFALAIANLLTKRARAMADQLFELSTLRMGDRLRLELRRLALAQGVASGRVVIHPAPTHQALAARVSTSRESVSRELSRLGAQGLISCSRQRITILDLARLALPAPVRR